MITPDFDAWTGNFASQLHRLRTTTGATLHQFELLFSPWMEPWRLAQQEAGAHSRDRRWNLRLVFWTFLWQVAQAGASCREAIRQAQAHCLALGRRQPPDTTSPFCQARSALPVERLRQIHQAVVAEAQRGIRRGDLWCGRNVIVPDGSSVTAPDSPENQKAYPQQSVQKPGCGFPIIRLVALLSLATGLLVQWSSGPWRQSELALLQTLWDCLKAGDVLLADRGFCNWGLLAQCLHRKIDVVFRVKGSARRDFRRGKRLSRHERLVQWRKPRKPAQTLSPQIWAALPEILTLRLVRCQIDIPGFRTHQVILVTTLLDSGLFPPEQLGQLYYRRWAMELTLRHLKTTLEMEHLSCLTPANLERELHLHFLVHNLVRRLMLEAARRHRVPLERVSFAGALAVARRYAEVMLRAKNQKIRRLLEEEMDRVLADDLVPERPGRREARAVKRRPKPYPRLMTHRRHFRETPHQNRYYKNSPSPQCRKSSKA